jgi:O-acetyl-ADP-ribose deacetylase (regulator of RNase III)
MTTIWIAEKDITTVKVDAIVCPVNEGLEVADHIRDRGGQDIQDECDSLGKVKPGDVAVTTAGKLPAKHLFHPVSVEYKNSDALAFLTGLTKKCLDHAVELEIKSLAFPNLVSGGMEISPEKSCQYMAKAITEFNFEAASIESIGFVLLDKEVFQIFSDLLPSLIKEVPGLEFSEKSPLMP